MNLTADSLILVYIGLGSNLADPLRQLALARQSIADLSGVQDEGFSSIYRSAPMGPQNQPDYFNAVMAITTSRDPHDLLRMLQTIEDRQGRVRKERWGARTLDLDILLFGERIIDSPDLVVPHAGIAQRAFVLLPLVELAGEQLDIPGYGALGELVKHCPVSEIEKLSE